MILSCFFEILIMRGRDIFRLMKMKERILIISADLILNVINSMALTDEEEVVLRYHFIYI